MINNRILIFACVFIITACSSVQSRIDLANTVASGANLAAKKITAGNFTLTTYNRISDINAPVDIYIEGDGFAWASRNRLSTNPTPKDAFTLKLAALDDASNVIYIARPCQYTGQQQDSNCAPKYWSGSRFSNEVVDSVNKAISYYTQKLKNPRVNLIGYSGGAAIAALVAARRPDVVSLRTVAGNLDHVAVNNFHHVSKLDNSLNPIDISKKLVKLPQYHFAGVEDKIIPLATIVAFAKSAEQGYGCVQVSSIEGATHHSGWEKHWKELLSEPVVCKSKTNKNK